MELSYNPFNETLEKVIALLNRLCLEKRISKTQHQQMMPDRSKVELAHLYFNPKTHKVQLNMNQIILFISFFCDIGWYTSTTY